MMEEAATGREKKSVSAVPWSAASGAGKALWLRRGLIGGICLGGIFLVGLTHYSGKYWLMGVMAALAVLTEAGFSLWNAQRQLQWKNQQLSTLSAISRAVQNKSQFDEILASIQVQVRQHLGVDNFYVAIYDEANRQLWYPMAVKGGEIVYWAVRPLTDRLTDRVIETQQPILLASHAHEELQRIGLPLGDQPLTAWMGVPLFISHRIVGCLAVFSYSPFTVFTPDDLGLLETLAGQVSVAVENMFLSQEIQQRREQIEQMHHLNRQKELLTETLVHDLRSPMGTVISALEVINETTRSDASEAGQTIQRAAFVAMQGAQRVLALVEGVLEIARLEEGQEFRREAVKPAELLLNLAKDVQPRCVEAQLGMKVQLAADLPVLWMDKEKVRRALENLLDNAIKFTPAGGEIRLCAEKTAEDWLEIRVEDSGPGIPLEHRQKVFERFYQVPGVESKRRGSGLGLTFCKLVMDAHGGEMRIESSAEGGCCVVTRLPIADVNPEAEA